MSRDPMTDMHGEAWWMRALEGELSGEEAEDWQAHLAQCPSCRQEWAAMTQVDMILRTAAPPPLLPADFTARTVMQIAHRQKLLRMLRFVVGFLIVAAVAWIGFIYFDTTLDTLVRAASVVISRWQILFAAFMRTLVGLAITVKTLLPMILGIATALFLFLTPNSVLATVLVAWVSQKKRARAAAAM
ncbi:MAG TPA: anti-sigma factor [Anaerolineae bacterium]|mgnify:CR=1 FL=1|nr:anti-sigma factor [Anaerolineae bacterium]HQH38165.1 anti-sigma factor [Anaerolineae bacterium]